MKMLAKLDLVVNDYWEFDDWKWELFLARPDIAITSNRSYRTKRSAVRAARAFANKCGIRITQTKVYGEAFKGQK